MAGSEEAFFYISPPEPAIIDTSAEEASLPFTVHMTSADSTDLSMGSGGSTNMDGTSIIPLPLSPTLQQDLTQR